MNVRLWTRQMSRRRTALAVLVAVFSLVVSSAGPVFAQRTEDATPKTRQFTVEGTWLGRYFYEENKTSVNFELVLVVSGGSCSGRMSEPNTFGNPSAPNLYANITCTTVGVA